MKYPMKSEQVWTKYDWMDEEMNEWITAKLIESASFKITETDEAFVYLSISGIDK